MEWHLHTNVSNCSDDCASNSVTVFGRPDKSSNIFDWRRWRLNLCIWIPTVVINIIAAWYCRCNHDERRRKYDLIFNTPSNTWTYILVKGFELSESDKKKVTKIKRFVKREVWFLSWHLLTFCNSRHTI